MTAEPTLFKRAVLKLLIGGCAAAMLAACGSEDASLDTGAAGDGVSAADQIEATFYLVRHAEKELEGKDPALSPAGYARAKALAGRLQDVKLTAIYSTDTRRTRDTAADVAAQKRIDIDLYDGRALEDFALSLAGKTGEFLIVGHSNTTAEMVEFLGGEGGDPIVEATEYDRFYIVRKTGGAVVTELERY